MTFNEFAEELKRRVEKNLGEEYTISRTSMVKANDAKLDGLICRKVGDTVGPTIYINEAYEFYSKGEVTLDTIARDLARSFIDSMGVLTKEAVDSILSMSWVKDRVIYRVVNTSLNKEYLEDKPSVKFLDLSVVYLVPVYVGATELGTVAVTDHLMDKLGIDVETLDKYATKNTSRDFKVVVKEMSEILQEMLTIADRQSAILEKDLQAITDERLPMYVMSNPTRIFGAATILYAQKELKKLSKKLGSDLYILPSSTHEVILLPANFVDNVTELKVMVREVNLTQVEESDLLSFSVYRYSRDTEEITIAA